MTILDDDFGVADHLLHYPAVVISANEDVKAVAPEVIRRTVICRVQAGLTNTEVMRSNVVRTVQREIGTAFYREYLRRMLVIVSDLLEDIKDDFSESAPDILAASSQVLLDIFSEYMESELPSYIRPLTLEDYFSESPNSFVCSYAALVFDSTRFWCHREHEAELGLVKKSQGAMPSKPFEAPGKPAVRPLRSQNTPTSCATTPEPLMRRTGF